MMRVLAVRIDSPLSDKKLFSHKLFLEIRMCCPAMHYPVFMGYITSSGTHHKVSPVVTLAEFRSYLHTRPEDEEAARGLSIAVELQNMKTGATQLFPLNPSIVVRTAYKEQQQ